MNSPRSRDRSRCVKLYLTFRQEPVFFPNLTKELLLACPVHSPERKSPALLSLDVRYVFLPRSPTSDRGMYYPSTGSCGLSSRRRGKRVTPHQWAMYDFTHTIPVGKVVIYKDVFQAVRGSPRS
ncbi:hypothetical protein DFH08DRAFT_725562, partial [Mycena albidolilacea]